IARSVEDLALVLPIIAGPDGRDADIAPAPIADGRQLDLSRLRIAMFTDNGIAPTAREIVAAVGAAGAALARAGAVVADARPPGIEQTFELFLGLFAADGGAGIQMLLEMFGTKEPSPEIQGLLAAFSGTSLSAAQFAGLLFQWDRFRSTMLAF